MYVCIYIIHAHKYPLKVQDLESLKFVLQLKLGGLLRADAPRVQGRKLGLGMVVRATVDNGNPV